MTQHRKCRSKLSKLPPFGKDWPEDERDKIRLPQEEDQPFDDDDLPDENDDERLHENDQEEEQIDLEEVAIEGVVYANDVEIDEETVGALRPRRGGERINYRRFSTTGAR